ncbi:MAG: hypothetical protein ACRC1U_04575 [Vibrionaceae bacterium]
MMAPNQASSSSPPSSRRASFDANAPEAVSSPILMGASVANASDEPATVCNVNSPNEYVSVDLDDDIELLPEDLSCPNAFCRWLTTHSARFGAVLEHMARAGQGLYGAVNPVLILQAKIGGANSLAANYGTWAQSGLQINIISRGINYRHPIIQLFVHNEAGFSADAGAMGLLNTGINLVPDANGVYSTSYMVENVQRIDASRHLIESSAVNFGASLNVGYDSSAQRFWQGRRGIAAGILTTGAQVAGSVLGWLAGNAIDTANEAAAGLAAATMPSSTSSAPSMSMSSFTSMQPEQAGHRVFRFADLMTSFGAFLATNGMVNALTSTRMLSPTSTLHMSEVTIGLGEMLLNIPICGTREVLTLAALPRFNLTRGQFDQMDPTSLVANVRALPRCGAFEQDADEENDDDSVINQTPL